MRSRAETQSTADHPEPIWETRAEPRRRGLAVWLPAFALAAFSLAVFTLAVLFTPLIGGVAAADTEGIDESGESAQPLDTPSFDDAAAQRLIPDIVVSIPASPTAGDDAAALIRDLGRSPSIAWAADDQLSPEAPRILVAFQDDASPAGGRAVAAAIAETENAESITVAGLDVSDRELLSRVGLGIFIGVALASIAFGALISWLMSLLHGLVAGFTLGASAWLGGMIGSAVAGRFDGSLVTTAIPAMMTAIVLAVYVSLRLFAWFSNPTGDDQAEMIRRSALDVAVELLIFFAAFAVATAFLELVALAPTVARVAFAGAVVGAVLPLAVLPAMLVALRSSTWFEGLRSSLQPRRSNGDAQSPVEIEPDGIGEIEGIGGIADTGEVPVLTEESKDRNTIEAVLDRVRVPSGREFPVFALIGFALFLGLLGLFALRSTGRAVLLDERSLGIDSPAVVGTRSLLTSGGDPTAGVLARFPSGTGQAEKEAWLAEVSELTSVARIDTAVGRHIDGAFTEIAGLMGPAGAADAEAPGFALVVPEVTGRSGGAIDLVEEIKATDGPVEGVLAGSPADALAADQRNRLQVWLTIVAFAVAGAAAALTLIGDRTLAALSFVLRCLGLAAAAGLYQLLVSDPSGAELLLVIVVVAVGTMLFELGFLRRVLEARTADDADQRVDHALNHEGTAAAVSLGMAALAALGLLVPDLTMLRRFAILVAVVVLVETIIGLWLLRPAVLGARALAHFASRPVGKAISVLSGRGATSGTEHEAWVDAVAGLLWTEFTFQSDPRAAVIGSVYVPGSALYQSSADHHESLADAGLRIVGRHPQLRSLRVVNNSSPATVVVTVDHPVRQLTDATGKIVGVRKAERRSVILWLLMQDDGSYRIIDSVELGASSLGVLAEPLPTPSVIAAPAQ